MYKNVEDYLTIRFFILKQSIKVWREFLRDYFLDTAFRISSIGFVTGAVVTFTYILRDFTKNIVAHDILYLMAGTVLSGLIFGFFSIIVSFIYCILFPYKIFLLIVDPDEIGEVNIIKHM